MRSQTPNAAVHDETKPASLCRIPKKISSYGFAFSASDLSFVRFCLASLRFAIPSAERMNLMGLFAGEWELNAKLLKSRARSGSLRTTSMMSAFVTRFVFKQRRGGEKGNVRVMVVVKGALRKRLRTHVIHSVDAVRAAFT